MPTMKISINALNRQTEKWTLRLVALAFVLWSVVFIDRTSFIAIDGRRYFCLFDDAMISMRYAWNFSHGLGLVWNAGERVQGYTNLLMTLIMSLATLVFDKSIASLAIQILGLGLMLGIAYVNLKIANAVFMNEKMDQPQQALIRILAFAFPLLYYPLSYWSLTGMETGLLTLLLLAGVLSAICYTQGHRTSHLLGTSLYLGLAFLTRNDSLIFALLIGSYIGWNLVSQKMLGRAIPSLIAPVLVYVIIVTGQFLFQVQYYGEWLPNTYTLKLTGMSLADRLSNGFGFILPFLVQISFVLIPASVGVFLQFSREKLLLLSLFLSTIAYQVYVGGDPWSYWRMMSPAMPLLGILFISVVNFGVSAQAGRSRILRGTGPAAQVLIIVLIGLLVANAYFLPEALFLDRPFYVSANQHNVNIAVALSEITTPQASAGILWAGAIPYFSERKGIDFLGKSDRYIAQLPPDMSGKIGVGGLKSPPGHNKYDLNYSIKQLQPTFIQATEWGTQDVTAWAKTRYVLVQYKGVDLLLLRDSPFVLWEKLPPP
jgi:arabinofuranosyltransferase